MSFLTNLPSQHSNFPFFTFQNTINLLPHKSFLHIPSSSFPCSVMQLFGDGGCKYPCTRGIKPSGLFQSASRTAEPGCFVISSISFLNISFPSFSFLKDPKDPKDFMALIQQFRKYLLMITTYPQVVTLWSNAPSIHLQLSIPSLQESVTRLFRTAESTFQHFGNMGDDNWWMIYE